MIRVGFTGTQHGMTDEQYAAFEKILRSLSAKKGKDVPQLFEGRRFEFHHGNCIGADEEASEVAFDLKAYIVSHPCTLKDKQGTGKAHITLPKYAPLVRNKHIVDATEVMVATPSSKKEAIRSGTWATVRYALKQKRPVYLVYPDGTSDVKGRAPAKKPAKRSKE